MRIKSCITTRRIRTALIDERDRISIASSDLAQSHARVILVRKLNPCSLKSIPDHGQRRSALLTLASLE